MSCVGEDYYNTLFSGMTTLNSSIELVLVEDSGVSYHNYILLVKVDVDGHVCRI